MASNSRINTVGQVQHAPAYPVLDYPTVISASAVMVMAVVWLPDALYAALRPLGGRYDMSVALWLMVACVPLLVLLTASAGSVLWARNRHVGEYGHLNESLGSRGTVLAAACAVVEHVALYALIIVTMISVLVSQWPSLYVARRPLSIALALAMALPSALGLGRWRKAGAAVTVVATASLMVLTGVVMGGSPFFRTTTASELAAVSKEVTQRSHSSVQLTLAMLAAFTIALTPALLVRYVNTDLRAFAPSRSRYGAITTMVIALAGAGLLILTLGNIGDVESQRFVTRNGALLGATRWLHLPHWIVTVLVLVLLALGLAAARVVLHDGGRLGRELAHGHMFPHGLNSRLQVSSAVPWYALAAAVLVAAVGVRVEAVVPALVISGFGSFALTRWASWRYWNEQLRVEGHSQRRKSMKKARLIALVGFLISVLVVAAFVLADLRRAAWMAVAAIVILYAVLYAIRRYYLTYGTSTLEAPLPSVPHPGAVHYLLVVSSMGPLVERSVAWLQAMEPASAELVHIDRGGGDGEDVQRHWRERKSVFPLTVLADSGSHFGDALIDHVRRLRQQRPNTLMNVVIPCVIFERPINALMHNREVERLQRRCQREEGVMVTIIPWVADSAAAVGGESRGGKQ